MGNRGDRDGKKKRPKQKYDYNDPEILFPLFLYFIIESEVLLYRPMPIPEGPAPPAPASLEASFGYFSAT